MVSFVFFDEGLPDCFGSNGFPDKSGKQYYGQDVGDGLDQLHWDNTENRKWNALQTALDRLSKCKKQTRKHCLEGPPFSKNHRCQSEITLTRRHIFDKKSKLCGGKIRTGHAAEDAVDDQGFVASGIDRNPCRVNSRGFSPVARSLRPKRLRNTIHAVRGTMM